MLTGSGPLLQALANSQLRAGVHTVPFAPFGESPFDRDRVAEHLDASREQGPEQRVVHLDADAEQLDQVAADATMVLHVADRPMIDRSRRLPAAAAAAGASSAKAVVVGEEAWVGPVIGGNDDPTRLPSGDGARQCRRVTGPG
ncbi:hypothetical protein [Kitasatospora sp. NPDC059827]|uniref:hypothetical protein n=1 Tax=Kitasatospora sp. NPDC059827 TaxID=3346964 RepID=UPI00365D25A9